jgi:hypothetical protein
MGDAMEPLANTAHNHSMIDFAARVLQIMSTEGSDEHDRMNDIQDAAIELGLAVDNPDANDDTDAWFLLVTP